MLLKRHRVMHVSCICHASAEVHAGAEGGSYVPYLGVCVRILNFGLWHVDHHTVGSLEARVEEGGDAV